MVPDVIFKFVFAFIRMTLCMNLCLGGLALPREDPGSVKKKYMNLRATSEVQHDVHSLLSHKTREDLSYAK